MRTRSCVITVAFFGLTQVLFSSHIIFITYDGMQNHLKNLNSDFISDISAVYIRHMSTTCENKFTLHFHLITCSSLIPLAQYLFCNDETLGSVIIWVEDYNYRCFFSPLSFCCVCQDSLYFFLFHWSWLETNLCLPCAGRAQVIKALAAFDNIPPAD